MAAHVVGLAIDDFRVPPQAGSSYCMPARINREPSQWMLSGMNPGAIALRNGCDVSSRA
jgi:hypothetical protein